ncbi:hypothetical protein N0V93_007579 [Gnomoniopsis smithogilvyi]|uniref:Rhodopsin domain-containing protein n=1 Tax=Gnomoniopsis smithogilvyi TaxID=1191159 RepID=A0A9W8YRV7_9PEZI|nr:hypothetical protein N0V93_007579 [Gnomoniopsis smithogilvyi]
MKARLKASVCAVLALGIIASAATVIRLPYLRYYNILTNYYYNVANIVLWSIVECGVGILAGSLPSLRSLLKSWIDKSSKGSSYQNTRSAYGFSGTTGLKKTKNESVKMGYITPKGRGNTTLVSASHGEGTWMELEDDNSQKHIIHRTLQVRVDVSESNSFNS